MKAKLAQMQEEVDKQFLENGLTDEILDKQLEINKLRHEHDISDERNRVYKNYVQ